MSNQNPLNGRFALISLAGQRFGSVVISGEYKKTSNGGTKWKFLCDSGHEGWAWAESLKRNPNFRCKECRKAVIAAARTTHGHRAKQRTRIYGVWQSMLSRCNNPNHKAYPGYGGRGITVCERWLVFENFLADMGEPGPNMSIGRIDNNGNYEPGNCRWESIVQQANNRRSNNTITLGGVTHTISEWSRILGIDKTTIRKRKIAGRSPEECLSKTSLRKKNS